MHWVGVAPQRGVVHACQVTSVGMVSPTQWTWVWASSGRWWRTWNPGMLQSRGLQRAGHDWVTEQHQHAQLEKISVYKIISHSKHRFLFLFLRQGGTLGNCVHVNCGLQLPVTCFILQACTSFIRNRIFLLLFAAPGVLKELIFCQKRLESIAVFPSR